MKKIDGVLSKLSSADLSDNIDAILENGIFIMKRNDIVHLNVVEIDLKDVDCNRCVLGYMCFDFSCNVGNRFIRYLKE